MTTLLLLALSLQDAGGVQWYATWEQARAEAKRLDRPIMLFSAAPHCHGVSGLW